MHNIITKRNYMPNVYFKAKLMLATKDDWLVQQKFGAKDKIFNFLEGWIPSQFITLGFIPLGPLKK